MSEEQRIQGNLLIAKYMGGKLTSIEGLNGVYKWTSETHQPFSDKLNFPNTLKYHESWDWLMPVVIKIFNLELINFPGYILQLADVNLSLTRLNIEELWKSIIKFIEWYNNEKNRKEVL